MGAGKVRRAGDLQNITDGILLELSSPSAGGRQQSYSNGITEERRRGNHIRKKRKLKEWRRYKPPPTMHLIRL